MQYLDGNSDKLAVDDLDKSAQSQANQGVEELAAINRLFYACYLILYTICLGAID